MKNIASRILGFISLLPVMIVIGLVIKLAVHILLAILHIIIKTGLYDLILASIIALGIISLFAACCLLIAFTLFFLLEFGTRLLFGGATDIKNQAIASIKSTKDILR